MIEHVAATGKYGFPKVVEKDVDASVRKLSRFAAKVAKTLWSKDPKTAEFLATHARKADSKSAKALMNAMSEIGPKVDRVAAGRTHGLYGFRSKTAKNALVACEAMWEEAGYVAHELHSRRADRHKDITGYLDKHCTETNCPYSTLLANAYPEDKFSLLDKKAMVLRVAAQGDAEDSGAGTANAFFFDAPKYKEVREFAEGATKNLSTPMTNVPAVVPKMVKEYDQLDGTAAQMKSQVNKTPPTPSEIIDETAGSDEFSTLSRYIVQTEQPTEAGVPEGRGDIDKAPDLGAMQARVTERYLRKLGFSTRS